ncbi:EF-hand superfamily Ca2+-modulated protein [Ascosphaera apis ARSEF 7405]|uniref:Calmodulin n=1 Tax=Ascosphaera apis ARSEF 7405 TaxID=392613 RepID=A0A167ZK41_9EURO|nr:EF-hand superfamily Ca2+-modulated protein [Ascosphaera apis ARSEF 7405]
MRRMIHFYLKVELRHFTEVEGGYTDNMPPKRRGAPTAGQPKRGRQSKLAKENDISAEEEFEIKEAFRMFSTKHEDYPDEKEGVIPTTDVRRALVALGLPPTDQSELTDILSAVDPDEEGYVTYEPFLAACALKLHSRTEESISAEVEHAYKLFTRGTDGPIQVSHLRKVARDLKQDVSDDLLKDMVREANGGEGTHAGVNMQQFKDVMMRAGIF